MKTLIIAGTMAIALASTAYAGPVAVTGYGEYAMEAEAFEFGLAADYAINAVTVGAKVVAIKQNGTDFAFDHMDLNAAYRLTDTADLYGKVTLDGDLNYSETTVGMALHF